MGFSVPAPSAKGSLAFMVSACFGLRASSGSSACLLLLHSWSVDLAVRVLWSAWVRFLDLKSPWHL